MKLPLRRALSVCALSLLIPVLACALCLCLGLPGPVTARAEEAPVMTVVDEPHEYSLWVIPADTQDPHIQYQTVTAGGMSIENYSALQAYYGCPVTWSIEQVSGETMQVDIHDYSDLEPDLDRAVSWVWLYSYPTQPGEAVFRITAECGTQSVSCLYTYQFTELDTAVFDGAAIFPAEVTAATGESFEMTCTAPGMPYQPNLSLKFFSGNYGILSRRWTEGGVILSVGEPGNYTINLAISYGNVCFMQQIPLTITGESVMRASGEWGDNLTWELSAGGTLTIRGNGEMADFADADMEEWRTAWHEYNDDIRSVVIENGVTTIGKDAFSGCAMSEISIPYSVTGIGENAFRGCPRLNGTTLPSALRSIGDSAFRGCPILGWVNVPYGVTSIGAYAFASCPSISYVMLHGGLTEIGPYAFSECGNLSDLTLPAGDVALGEYVFSYCTSLDRITVPAGWTCIPEGAFAGDTGLKNVIVSSDVTVIGESAFSGCASLTGISVPVGVTEIGDSAFSGCAGLTNVIYEGTPEQWNAIGIGENNGPLLTANLHCGAVGGSFGAEGDNLNWMIADGVLTVSGTGAMAQENTYIVIPWEDHRWKNDIHTVIVEDGVTTICDNAFYALQGLTDVSLPGSVVVIGRWAFVNDYALESITIPEGVVSLGDNAFQNCVSLTSVSIPASVTAMGNGLFARCSRLEEINVASGSTAFCSVDGVLFSGDMTQLIQYPAGKWGGVYSIPSGVTEIGGYAFASVYGLEGIIIPEGVTVIGECAFSDFGLTSISLPSTLSWIGDSAFNGSHLTQVTIPAGVTHIGSGAFGGCYSLTAIWVEGGSVSFRTSGGVLFSGDGSVLVQYPAAKDESWYIVPSFVRRIESGSFFGASALTGVMISEGVTEIGNQVFSGCYDLKTVFIPESLTRIEWTCFAYTYNLTDVCYGGSPEAWGRINIEYDNGTLDTAVKHWYLSQRVMTLPEDTVSIGSEAFAGVSDVTAFRIVNAAAQIADDAFDPGTILFVPAGSPLVQWAENNGYIPLPELR